MKHMLKLLALLITLVPDAGQSQSDDTLRTMTLEELIAIEITTGSKTRMSREKIPAVVSVFTREEIRDYGVRNLEDLLNLVPGSPRDARTRSHPARSI